MVIRVTLRWGRVVRGSIFIDPAQPNPPNNWPNPTHRQVKLWTHDPTQPIPNRTPYIKQQLACRKKISLCTSCHHHHPNAHHRNNANTHSITSITVILGLFQTDKTVMHQLQVFTKRICQSILDTKLHYIHDMYFSHICHFRPMTQPNPLITQIFDPFPTQPNPTQPNPRVNPTHGQLWLEYFAGIPLMVITQLATHCQVEHVFVMPFASTFALLNSFARNIQPAVDIYL